MADLTINDVREKFPQYKDLSDEQLAQGLHKKYYADMPFDDFSTKIGYKAEPKTKESGIDTFRKAIDPTPMVRGLTMGTLGFPGALEELGTYTIPRALGYKVEDQQSITGGKTLFPTPEEVGKWKMLQYEGGKPSKTQEKIEQAAEFVSGATGATGATGVAGLLKPGAKALGRAISGLRPEATATKMFGESGTVSDVGKSILTKLLDRLENLVSGRRAEAKKAFDTYFKEARPVEQNIFNDYVQSLERYKKMFGKDLSADEMKLIDDSIGRLAGKEGEAGIGRLEKERRKLNDISAGLDEEGYNAVRQQRAQSMADHLTKIINNHAPSSKEAFKIYKEASGPINQFAKSVGAKVTTKAGEFLPDVPKTDVSELPSSFFKSEQSIKDLKELSGDPAFAIQAAREHVASELQSKGLKTAVKVDSYIRSNKDWLKEVPDVLADLEKYKKSLSGGETIKKVGKAVPYIGGGLYAIEETKKGLGF